MDIKEIINLGGAITLDNLSDLSGSDISLTTDELREIFNKHLYHKSR
jgi:hypothetical protein